jgi:hypothetical protein
VLSLLPDQAYLDDVNRFYSEHLIHEGNDDASLVTDWGHMFWAANVLLAEITDQGAFHQATQVGGLGLQSCVVSCSGPFAADAQGHTRQPMQAFPCRSWRPYVPGKKCAVFRGNTRASALRSGHVCMHADTTAIVDRFGALSIAQSMLKQWICATTGKVVFTPKGRAYNIAAPALGATANTALLSVIYGQIRSPYVPQAKADRYTCFARAQARAAAPLTILIRIIHPGCSPLQ